MEIVGTLRFAHPTAPVEPAHMSVSTMVHNPTKDAAIRRLIVIGFRLNHV